jgi:acyl dehydratase
MPFSARRVGPKLQSRTKDVSTRNILAYAAGIGETGERYLDDAREGGVCAVPFYCASLEWQVVAANRMAPDTGLTLDEVRRTVHAKQDTVFHRPIRPGDQLITDARLVEVRGMKAGTLAVTELSTAERGTGDPVVTSWSTVIYRGTAMDGDPVSLDAVLALPVAPATTLAESCVETRIPIPREMAHVYCECADIWNPVHTEREVALAAGLPGIILQGTATWALAGKEIVDTYADGDGAALKRLCGRFVGMVIPGTTITVRHARAPDLPNVINYEVLAGNGAKAIDQGIALLG